MVKLWFMNDDPTTDPRLEHHLNPPQFLTVEELYKRTGVEYFEIDAETYKENAFLAEILKKHNFTYEDLQDCSEKCFRNIDHMREEVYTEHLHNYEETSFVLDGSGYFDVRDAEEKWIRIAIEKNDFIIIPKGLYHRFTLDSKTFIRDIRFFAGIKPAYKDYNRPADDMECRKEYLKHQSMRFVPMNEV